VKINFFALTKRDAKGEVGLKPEIGDGNGNGNG